MKKKNDVFTSRNSSAVSLWADELTSKKPYQSPKLTKHGALSDITLGGSPRAEESGLCGNPPGMGDGFTPCP